jgi:microcin C transport system permease protein
MRWIGIFCTLLGGLAAAGEWTQIAFPTARWFFSTSKDVPLLHLKTGGMVFPWFGWLAAALLVFAGLVMIVRSFTGGPPNPITVRRLARFRGIKRGYYSLMILIGLGGLAALDQVVVGKRALAVQYKGEWTFPAFEPVDLKNKDFGVLGEAEEAPVNYRKLKKLFHDSGEGRVILPLVPYDPTGDTLPPRSRVARRARRVSSISRSGSRKPYLGPRSADIMMWTRRRSTSATPCATDSFSGPADGWDCRCHTGLQRRLSSMENSSATATTARATRRQF